MHAKLRDLIVEPVAVGTGIARGKRAYGGEVGVGTLWRLVWIWLVRRLEVQRQRRDLGALTPWELKDIGVTPEQACRKAGSRSGASSFEPPYVKTRSPS